MRAFGVALVIISGLLTTASGRGRQPDPGAAPEAVVREWLTVLRQAYPLVRKPDEYRIALTRALELAARYPQNRLAAKTSEYTAFGLYNQFRFAEATRAYLRTKRLALAAGDAQTAAFSAHALSNIYLSAGNAGGALEAAQQIGRASCRERVLVQV